MTEYPYFPLFVNLSGKKILIVGAGSIALRRAEALSPFGAELMVTAPEGRPEMEKLAAVWNRRRFQEEDLEGAVLVLAATDDKELNSLVAELCRERGIPVNSCSDRTQCDFYFPGIARRENDGLGASGENIARLRQRKHYYFVPYGQDDPVEKPQSLKADLSLLPAALEAALQGRQLQPMLRMF